MGINWLNSGFNCISNYLFTKTPEKQKTQSPHFSTSSLSSTGTICKVLKVALIIILGTSLPPTNAVASSQEICKPIPDFFSNIETPNLSQERLRELQNLIPSKTPYDFSNLPTKYKHNAFSFYEVAKWLGNHIREVRGLAAEIFNSLTIVSSQNFIEGLKKTAEAFSKEIGKKKCITYVPKLSGSNYWVACLFKYFTKDMCTFAFHNDLERKIEEHKTLLVFVPDDAIYTGNGINEVLNQVYRIFVTHCWSKDCSSKNLAIYVGVPFQSAESWKRYTIQKFSHQNRIPPLKELVHVLPHTTLPDFTNRLSKEALDFLGKAYGNEEIKKPTAFLSHKKPPAICFASKVLSGKIPAKYAIHSEESFALFLQEAVPPYPPRIS